MMRYTDRLGHLDDGSRIVKKGRHRRYEEARAMKRGPDLDIEALFTDLENDPLSAITSSPADVDIEADTDDLDQEHGDEDDEGFDDEEYSRDDEYSDR